MQMWGLDVEGVLANRNYCVHNITHKFNVLMRHNINIYFLLDIHYVAKHPLHVN